MKQILALSVLCVFSIPLATSAQNSAPATQPSAGVPAAQARVVEVEGLVAAVDGDHVMLNVGAKAGIKVGDHMSVERVARTMKDPATGAVLRKIPTKLGELEVVDVDDMSAVCKTVSGSGFRIGDEAKSVSAAREGPERSKIGR